MLHMPSIKTCLLHHLPKVLRRFGHRPIAVHHIMQGVVQMLPNLPTIIFWAISTGIAMGEVLSPMQAIVMTLLAYAGSAQLVVLPIIVSQAPLMMALLAACVVNLRFIMYSIAVHPYFNHLPMLRRIQLGYLNGDFIYIHFLKKFPHPGHMRTQKMRQLYFYYGASVTNYLVWQCFNIAGIVLAAYIPHAWGLAFMGTLALMPIVLPMLLQNVLYLRIALVSCGLALYFKHLPYRLPILIALCSSIALFVLHAYTRKKILLKTDTT